MSDEILCLQVVRQLVAEHGDLTVTSSLAAVLAAQARGARPCGPVGRPQLGKTHALAIAGAILKNLPVGT